MQLITSSSLLTRFLFPASGVARGIGWQHIGAYVTLGSYYLVGIPASLLMGFVWNWKAKGLWCGLLMGSTVQAILLCIITGLTDWEKLVANTKDENSVFSIFTLKH